MGHNYSAKRRHGGNPNPRTEQIQEEQRQRREQAQAVAAAYATQDLPEIVIRNGQIGCLYASCNWNQRALTIGIHTCENGQCEKTCRVPDTDEREPSKQNIPASTTRDSGRKKRETE